MRFTSSFAVFRADPGEEDLAKARWFAREGQSRAAEREYREVLGRHPTLATGWIELFELLRRDGRHEDALLVAQDAGASLGEGAAMPLALQGAALAELGRTREAVKALEASIERDGNLALAWHELAYAAYRVGEYGRALLALDRAFALEPHTDTLILRGRILREGGQYEAAEVAFEAAMQAADYDIPKREAERENAATRRAASLGGRKPREFTVRERAFVQTGSVVLDTELVSPGDLADAFAQCITSVPPLVERLAWKPETVAPAAAHDAPLAAALAAAFGVPVALTAALDPHDRPLIVTAHNDTAEDWQRLVAKLARWGSGWTFALCQTPAALEPADLVGRIGALEQGLVLRKLAVAVTETDAPPLDIEEAAALAVNPRAPWRAREQA